MEALLAAWLPDGYRTFEQPNTKGGFEYLVEQAQPLPEQFTLEVGDALQCLRHSLDHLVYALAERYTPNWNRQQKKETEFPIGDRAIPSTDRRIRWLHPSARDEVCALAPDPGRNEISEDALWLLNKASNWDRHRELAVVGVVTAFAGSAPIGFDASDYFKSYTRTRIDMGQPPAALMEYGRSLGANPEVPLETAVIFDSGAGAALRYRDVIPTLRWFHDHIRDVVCPRLEPYL